MNGRRPLRLFGHPVHAMMAGMPVAFWLGSTLWDVAGLVLADPMWFHLAFWTLALGLALSVPVALSGLWELACLPEDHPAEGLAWRHMGWMLGAGTCFMASFVVRWGASMDAPPLGALVLSLVGALATSVGGWMGGEMVFRHGVAVEKRER